jgi:hypothetical protein
MPSVTQKSRQLGGQYSLWSKYYKRYPGAYHGRRDFATVQQRMVRLVKILKDQKARQRAKLIAAERAASRRLFSQPGAFKFRPKWRGVKRKRGYLSAPYPKKRRFRRR